MILGESERTCWKRWYVGRDLKNGNELPSKEKWAGDGKGRFVDRQKSRCKGSEKRQMAKCGAKGSLGWRGAWRGGVRRQRPYNSNSGVGSVS